MHMASWPTHRRRQTEKAAKERWRKRRRKVPAPARREVRTVREVPDFIWDKVARG